MLFHARGRGGPSRLMSQPIVSSGRSRIAAIALGVAALSLALPLSAHADGKHHGKRHGNHSRDYYQYESDGGYYGPPPAYYGGPPPCRGPKHVRVYNNYYPVPVAVPVYPAYPAYPQAYPQDYDAHDSKPVIRIGVDWVIGF